MALISLALGLGISVSGAAAVPAGFPSSGNGLWYTEPAVNWSTQYLPIGNGYLGAMVNGNPVSDRVQLNIESLWSGGPFADPDYNGGNHPASEAGYLATQLARIRNTIFTSSNGTIEGRCLMMLGHMAPIPARVISISTEPHRGKLPIMDAGLIWIPQS